jgi:Flp pilus assembly pilin Flp
MLGLWTAIAGRLGSADEGDDRAGIVEYALMIALVAVVVTASVLLVYTKLTGR